MTQEEMLAPWSSIVDPAVRVEKTLAAGLFVFISVVGFSLLSTPSPSLAAEISGFSFLRVTTSARSAALGGSGTAFLQGATSFYSNPANLSAQDRGASSTAKWGIDAEAGLIHHEAIGDLRQDVVTLNLQKGPDALAVSFNTFYSERIDRLDLVGELQGGFGLTDIYFGGAYAHTMESGLRLGGSLAYVSEDIAGEKANTWTVGLGTRWDLHSIQGLSLGLSVVNLGPDTEFLIEGTKGDKFSQPTTFLGGAAYQSTLGKETRWLISAEGRKARNDNVTGHFGLEVGYSIVALRGGGQAATDANEFTAGLGITAGSFQFDYAFVSHGEGLGDTHRAELGLRFGL